MNPSYAEQLQLLMSQVLKPGGEAPIHHCLLRVTDHQRNLMFAGAVGEVDETGAVVTPDCRFRTGSITKPFTATVVLQLVEEGLIQLHDPVIELLEEKLLELHILDGEDYSSQITVQHLLEHSSGLRDYFADDERFLSFVMQHPEQQWDWALIIEKYFAFGLHEKARFQPGQGFYYSDTNYLLLGMLIEHVSGLSLHQLYEERILGPLSLKDTFLEFFQTPKSGGEILYPMYGNVSLKDVNTSFDWAGGGLVSSMGDLEVFIRALLGGRLFKRPETLARMTRFDLADLSQTSVRRSMHYGLGLQQKGISGHMLIGHSSAYASMLYYEPEKDLSIVLTLNQAGAMHKAEWLLNKVGL